MNLSKRRQGAVPYELPKVCPVCGAPVTRDVDGAAVRALVRSAHAQLLRNITHFASRDAMDIDGLGPAVLQQLIETGLIRSAADLYSLTEQDFAQLDRNGGEVRRQRSVRHREVQGNDLGKLLYALGIRQVAQKRAGCWRCTLSL